MADDNNIHNGHRERMKKQFIENDLDNFLPHQVLELLLFYAIPRRDTNPMAHKLLNEFGSISSILDAPIEMLMKEGLSESSAVLLKLIPSLSRVYLVDKHKNRDKIVLEEDIFEYMSSKFIGIAEEVVILLLMDAKGKEVYSGIVRRGSVNSVDLYMRGIMNLCLNYNANSAILAHNHPSGVAFPSKADLETTEMVSDSLKVINVKLLDHIIVADGNCVSLRKEGFDCF